MDGDGTAAGDLPYSIEDVPYVHVLLPRYALHGAFWHTNYGVQMSHGCVNLAPLDAKCASSSSPSRACPRGSTACGPRPRPGTRVVVHD